MSEFPSENQKNIDPGIEKVLSTYTPEQLIAADQTGSLYVLVREANYDYDIDLPDASIDLVAATEKVRQIIYEGADIVRIRFNEEEQDAVLQQAVKAEESVLHLTPGMLRTLKERKH